MNSRLHNLSLSGITGIIAGLLGVGYLYLINFLIDGHTTASAGVSLLPLNFFHLLITTLTILALFFLYFAIIIINKKRRKKLNLNRWSIKAKRIRVLFFLQILLFGIFAYYLVNNGKNSFLIPSFLTLLSVFILWANRYANGNTIILGSIVLFCGVFSLVLNDYSFLAWIIACGICPILYGLYYLIKK
ncbi:hypothetical protein [Lutibacter sp.]|uniref:hypothetical protein n=1 Tax=Lutibacter sp. TaxID=1925666 RepID=UPI002737559D|nr:hypothetical protein [Lutibacter sp.]MDP3311814.1 hypothetical protein [Lutibacter sp.]